jgi:hypothetical protein
MAEQLSSPSTTIALAAAARLTGMSYARLRSLAVDRREFTIFRDLIGKGVQIYLRRDEVTAFDNGALTGLRVFRGRAGHWPQPGGSRTNDPARPVCIARRGPRAEAGHRSQEVEQPVR